MLMTGYADQRERAHGLDALVHDVIAKPFSVDQIKDAVREALCRSGINRISSEILEQPLDVIELESAGASSRRSACATLPGCGARAAHRSRPAP